MLQNIVDIVGLGTLSRTNHIDKRVHLYEGFFLEARAGTPSLFLQSSRTSFATDKRRSSSQFDSKNRMAGWPVFRYFCRRWPAWPAPMLLGKT